MHKDDEEEYLAFCSEAMFRIHILELRLNRSVPAKKDNTMEAFLKQRLGLRLRLRLCTLCTQFGLDLHFQRELLIVHQHAEPELEPKPRFEKSPMGLFQA